MGAVNAVTLSDLTSQILRFSAGGKEVGTVSLFLIPFFIFRVSGFFFFEVE